VHSREAQSVAQAGYKRPWPVYILVTRKFDVIVNPKSINVAGIIVTFGCHEIKYMLHLVGIMALLALSFLTPYFYYIPRATLSAILICAVVFVIDLRIIKSLWRGCS